MACFLTPAYAMNGIPPPDAAVTPTGTAAPIIATVAAAAIYQPIGSVDHATGIVVTSEVNGGRGEFGNVIADEENSEILSRIRQCTRRSPIGQLPVIPFVLVVTVLMMWHGRSHEAVFDMEPLATVADVKRQLCIGCFYLGNRTIPVSTLITYFRMLSEPLGQYIPQDTLVYTYAINTRQFFMPIKMKLEHRSQEDGSEPEAPYSICHQDDSDSDEGGG